MSPLSKYTGRPSALRPRGWGELRWNSFSAESDLVLRNGADTAVLY